MAEILEPKNKRKPRVGTDSGVYATLGNSEWNRLMAESLKGAEDKELADKYGVSMNTIRQRRYNDTAWRVAHDRLKEVANIGAREIVPQARDTPLTLAEIANLNPDLIANYTYKALKASIDAGLIPLPTSWSEAKTAMDMMRKATGQDDKTTNVNIALWSGGSVSPAPSIAVHEAEIVPPKAEDDWI